MRAAILAVLASGIAFLVLVNLIQGQASNLTIIQLDCDTNPEVITIKNLGDAAQALSGWELQSDPNQSFDLTVVGTLDPAEQVSIFSGSNAPETNAGAGQYRWTLSFKLRNGDPTDYARIVDGGSNTIDQLNCGDPPPTPVPSPTPTTPATATLTPTHTPTPTPTSFNLPDLVVQSMVIELETGGACDFVSTELGVRVVVGNVGSAEAGPFVVDVNGSQQTVTSGLPQGETLSLWFAGHLFGENMAFVDATFQVEESNEENNQLSQSVPVPTLPLTCTATPTNTPTPSPTPTKQPAGDTDGDGCLDTQENGPDETLGGRRDYLNFWDFFDPNRDRAVGLLDFLAVLRHFNTAGDPSTLDPDGPEPPPGEYWASADRGGQAPGGVPWDELPANGSIGLPDFLSVLRQFGHTCAASTVSYLEIHHIDVEQGDATLIISPGGETAMVDVGGIGCQNTVDYLVGLGIGSIDYHFASHYHEDHIGCLAAMASAGITVETACYDRGGAPSAQRDFFDDYVAACGDKRETVSQGQVITLDEGAAIPVAITVVALDGAGVSMSSSEENGRSLVLRLTYGAFDEVIAGDLTGQSPDVESVVAPQVGDVEIYHVNHHGSNTSSNDAWLSAISAEVGVLSVGANGFGHPTAEVLARLHAHNIQTYWTNAGSGVAPDPLWDQVGGSIVIEAMPGVGDPYTVAGTGFTDAYVNE